MHVQLPAGGEMESMDARDMFLVIGEPGNYNNIEKSDITKRCMKCVNLTLLATINAFDK